MERNKTIDVLRAVVMLLMIFVNDLWSIDGYPQWLGHSAAMDDFMGLADIVFPCFLIVMGMSIPYAIEGRLSKGQSGVEIVRHILGRWLALIVMGVYTVNSESRMLTTTGMGVAWFRILMVVGFLLIWNNYDIRGKSAVYKRIVLALRLLGVAILLFLGISYRNADGGLLQSHWWGILGIIGWTYLFCALLYLLVRGSLPKLLTAWAVLTALCCLGSIRHGGGTLLDLPAPNIIDQMLGFLHIGNGCEAALATGGIIISVLWQRRLRTLKSSRLIWVSAAASAALLGAGVVANQFFITSKIMSTAPWLFYNLSIIAIAYGVVACLDRANMIRWYWVISPAGSSTLTCYLMPYLAYSLISLTGFTLPHVLCTGALGIVNCIVFAFLIVWLTGAVGRLGIKLKL